MDHFQYIFYTHETRKRKLCRKAKEECFVTLELQGQQLWLHREQLVSVGFCHRFYIIYFHCSVGILILSFTLCTLCANVAACQRAPNLENKIENKMKRKQRS